MKMPNPDLTAAELQELNMWRSILDDRTRPPQDHERAKAAIDRLNIEGPWIKIKELEARVEQLEADVAAFCKRPAKKAAPAKATKKATPTKKTPPAPLKTAPPAAAAPTPPTAKGTPDDDFVF